MAAFQAGERLDRHALKAPFVSVEVGFDGFTGVCERCPEDRRAKWNQCCVILHIPQTLRRRARIGPDTFTALVLSMVTVLFGFRPSCSVTTVFIQHFG